MTYIYGVLSLVAAIVIGGTAYAMVVDGARREAAEKAALRMDEYMRHLESREKEAAADLATHVQERSDR